MIARALAESAGCSFHTASIASLKSENQGGTGKRVAELWSKLRVSQPAVLFIDECEGVFSRAAAPIPTASGKNWYRPSLPSGTAFQEAPACGSSAQPTGATCSTTPRSRGSGWRSLSLCRTVRQGQRSSIRKLECPAFSVPVRNDKTGVGRSLRWHEARSIRQSRL